MRLLVDTQVFLWMRAAPSRFSRKVSALLVDPKTELLLSAATPWEIAIKVAIGKLSLPCSVEEYVASRSAALRMTHFPITHLHAVESATLPPHHRDPFDRVLIAQARLEGVPIMAADRIFDAYEVQILRPR